MEQEETVALELNPDTRLRLYSQITGRMEKLGLNPMDFKQLELGYELPEGWPVDMNAEPTLAQLVVFAHKLKMKLIISNIDFVPRKDE